MPGGQQIKITKDLSDALELVLGRRPTTPEPVVVLSAYLDSLAKRYGLSDSQHIDADRLAEAEPPAPALALVEHYFTGGTQPLNADIVRDHLGAVFMDLSDDLTARKILDGNRPLNQVEFLHVGQVYWNLEARGARSGLPIQADQTLTGGKPPADIKVPGRNEDFATMGWTSRVGIGLQGPYTSSGQSFRTKGARLAVLAADRIIADQPGAAPSLDGAILNHTTPERGEARITSISWPAPARAAEDPAAALESTTSPTNASPAQSTPGTARGSVPRVLVGTTADVGAGYQRRSFDDEIETHWANDGDRRVWLVGGPGLGKSFSARRIMHEAIADQKSDREDLLIWVDSADAATVTTALADAVDQLRAHGVAIPGGDHDPADRKAEALLGTLAICPWRWLIVFDNADADTLIEAKLVPATRNPHGRLLVTTLKGPRSTAHGRIVAAGLFTAEEAEAYLHGGATARVAGRGSTGPVTGAEARALARCVGYHPLALSIAAATIDANAMTVADWIGDFSISAAMDAAADEPDRGGYPRLIGGAWEVALARASRGLSDDVVERAALIAAAQDPDGHPTWLWHRDAVQRWIGADAPTLRHRMPLVVKRLIEYGIVELRGESWSDGHLTIHQLAGRAVREHASPEDLAQAAEILADEWLVFLTEPESVRRPSEIRDVVRSNALKIGELPGLSATTWNRVIAIDEYTTPLDHQARLEREVATLEVLRPYLLQGGVLGNAELARKIESVASHAAGIGRTKEAQSGFIQALAIYQALLADGSLPDELRAGYLMMLGALHKKLGQFEESQANLARAARMFEQYLEDNPESREIGVILVNLADIYEATGQDGQRAGVLARTDRLSEDPAHHEARDGEAWRATRRLRRGKQLRWFGRLEHAKTALLRVVANAEEADRLEHLELEALRELALVHVEAGEWADAERVLTGLVAEDPWDVNMQALLASLHSRQGNLRAAVTTLAAIAERHAPRAECDEDSARASERRLKNDAMMRRAIERDRELHGILLNELVVTAMQHERWADAEGLATGALTLMEQRAEAEPGDHESELATVHGELGMIYFRLGRLREAEEHSARAVSIQQMLAELDRDDLAAKSDLKNFLQAHGAVLTRLGKHKEAIASLERAATICTELISDKARSDDTRASLSMVLLLLIENSGMLGQPDRAADYADRRVQLWEAAVDPELSDDVQRRRELADALFASGMAKVRAGRLEEATSPLRHAVDTWNAESELEPDDHALTELARSTSLLGLVQVQIGATDQGLTLIERSVAAFRNLADQDPSNYELQQLLASSLTFLGIAHEKADNLDGSVDALTGAVNLFQLLADLDPGKHENHLVISLRGLAETLKSLGRLAEAETATSRADDVTRRFPNSDQ